MSARDGSKPRRENVLLLLIKDGVLGRERLEYLRCGFREPRRICIVDDDRQSEFADLRPAGLHISEQFTELRQKQPPIGEIIDHPKAQQILDNPTFLNEIWELSKPHLTDLEAYLKTGQSA